MQFEYTEIFKLKEMLGKAGVDFEYECGVERFGFAQRWEHHHIWIFDKDGEQLVSVIQNDHSFGHEEDLLEIRGLLTEEEEQESSVKGYITADEVFQRIVKAIEGGKDEE